MHELINVKNVFNFTFELHQVTPFPTIRIKKVICYFAKKRVIKANVTLHVKIRDIYKVVKNNCIRNIVLVMKMRKNIQSMWQK